MAYLSRLAISNPDNTVDTCLYRAFAVNANIEVGQVLGCNGNYCFEFKRL